jgi:hypothetical protein
MAVFPQIRFLPDGRASGTSFSRDSLRSWEIALFCLLMFDVDLSPVIPSARGHPSALYCQSENGKDPGGQPNPFEFRPKNAEPSP